MPRDLPMIVRGHSPTPGRGSGSTNCSLTDTQEIMVKSQEKRRLGVRIEKARIHVPMKHRGTWEFKRVSCICFF